jgi:hypothetical protein
MTRKRGDAPVVPIRPQAPVTAGELRTARDALARAETAALEVVSRVLAECRRSPPASWPGPPGSRSTTNAAASRGTS